MGVELLYLTVPGRFLLKLMNETKLLKLAEVFVKSPFSIPMIKPFIRKNHIDMSEYKGQRYKSYADFFVRKKAVNVERKDDVLISPCDSLLSVYDIEDDSTFNIKGIAYTLRELIPDERVCKKFSGGSFLVFRLCASDYHHFCYVDDCVHGKMHFIPGKLHSVQPIACSKEPVYRVNRRVWSLMKTKRLGLVCQLEVGAVLVGGIVHEKQCQEAKYGEEMGRFELAGSTIVLMLEKDVKERLMYREDLSPVISGVECRVKYGEAIAKLLD